MGGLGVADLKLASFALQARWLWLQKMDDDRAWAGLPIKVHIVVRALFTASTFIKVGNGAKTLFWVDS